MLAGALVGALLMTVLPVSAHHGDSARRLQRQINVLKDKTQFMLRSGAYDSFIFDAQVLSECGDATDTVWAPSQIPDLRSLSCPGGGALSTSRNMARSFKASNR